MSIQIVMPQLGESVAEGVIGKWLKQEGDPIAKDEPIVEVVTDKVNAEIPSPVAGTLLRITVAEGVTIAVGEEIAVIGDASEELDHQPSRVKDANLEPESSNVESAAQSSPAEPEPMASANPQTAPLVASQSSGQPRAANERRVVRSSPLVQRLAQEHNVDLNQVQGTGIGGRVSKRDILEYASAGSTSHSPVTASAGAPPVSPATSPVLSPGGSGDEFVPVSAVRRMIADHMVKSKTALPHATSMIEIDMTPVVRYRDAQKAEWQRTQGIPLSFMAFVAMATVESLRQHPFVNSEWAGDKIILKRNINLGLAVAAENGLIVPNIKNAERLSLGGMAHAVNDLTVRARAGKLTPDDVSGGTFTLNNTGAIGSIWSISIINFPQAGILSADAIVKRVRVMPDDSIAIRHIMNLSMSFDHRTLDGSQIANFMQFIRTRLETWPKDAAI